MKYIKLLLICLTLYGNVIDNIAYADSTFCTQTQNQDQNGNGTNIQNCYTTHDDNTQTRSVCTQNNQSGTTTSTCYQ